MIFCSGVWQRCCGVPPLWSVKCCCNISTIWEWLLAPSLSPICLPCFLCSFTTIFSSHLNILNPGPGCAYKQKLSKIKSRPNELFLKHSTLHLYFLSHVTTNTTTTVPNPCPFPQASPPFPLSSTSVSYLVTYGYGAHSFAVCDWLLSCPGHS